MCRIFLVYWCSLRLVVSSCLLKCSSIHSVIWGFFADFLGPKLQQLLVLITEYLISRVTCMLFTVLRNLSSIFVHEAMWNIYSSCNFLAGQYPCKCGDLHFSLNSQCFPCSMFLNCAGPPFVTAGIVCFCVFQQPGTVCLIYIDGAICQNNFSVHSPWSHQTSQTCSLKKQCSILLPLFCPNFSNGNQT